MTLTPDQAALRAIRHNVGQALSTDDPEKVRQWLREIGRLTELGDIPDGDETPCPDCGKALYWCAGQHAATPSVGG